MWDKLNATWCGKIIKNGGNHSFFYVSSKNQFNGASCDFSLQPVEHRNGKNVNRSLKKTVHCATFIMENRKSKTKEEEEEEVREEEKEEKNRRIGKNN